MLRVKFRCWQITLSSGGETIHFIPLPGASRNAATFHGMSVDGANPSDLLEICITDPDERGKFEVDKEYYLDVSPASVPSPELQNTRRVGVLKAEFTGTAAHIAPGRVQ